MGSCLDCDKKDKEITDLRALVEFHKNEENSWRELFNQQRGGYVFNKLQKDYADVVIENIRLRNANKENNNG